MYRKDIVYNPEAYDYAMYLNGELVGFARTPREAEMTLDRLISELVKGQHSVRTDEPTKKEADSE